MQLMLGSATPEFMAYIYPDLQKRRDEHLK